MDQLDKYLWDIIECIRKINRYLTLKGRRFDVFQNDTIYNDAIRWNVALIGEAMNKAAFYQHLQDWNRQTMLMSTLDFDNPSFQGISPLTP